MSNTLLNIERWACANRSGVLTVKLVIPDQVLSYTDSEAEAGITVKPGAEIYHIGIDPRTGYHQETLKQGDNGDYHEQRVGFNLKRLRQNVVTLRRKLMNQRVHVIFTDANEETYLFLNQRLRTATAGNPAQGSNGTRLEFAGASVLPSEHVHGILLPGPTDTETDTGQDTSGPTIPDPGADTGTDGGAEGDDIGGDTSTGTPGSGGTPGTTPDPGTIRFLQPTTGNYFLINIDECGLPYTTPE